MCECVWCGVCVCIFPRKSATSVRISYAGQHIVTDRTVLASNSNRVASKDVQGCNNTLLIGGQLACYLPIGA